MAILTRVFRIFCSIKLAVILIAGLAASLAAATFVESLYDTATAQYFVYRALWFHLLLATFGVMIICVALSRLPWKLRHTPFLMAHLGITLLLLGSWITDRHGVDGSLRVTEGEIGSVVELSQNMLIVAETSQARQIPIQWLPPSVKFAPIDVRDHGLTHDLVVDEYLAHANSDVSFVAETPAPAGAAARAPAAAIKIQVQGGPMRVKQDYWLWAGQPQWSTIQAGPARLAIVTEFNPLPPKPPAIEILREPDGTLAWKSFASDGGKSQGKLAPGKISGAIINPGWRGGVTIEVKEWIADARPLTKYAPSTTLYGKDAPASAIHVTAGKGADAASTWLGLGDRAEMRLDGRAATVAYFPERLILPFGVRLDRFTVKTQDGTRDPASYESRVRVMAEKTEPEQVISMNEPLKRSGFTLYQASYEDAQPRPVTSILSVNRDPGRPWKYGGSLLIVGGTILLFAMKYRRARQTVPRSPSAPSASGAVT